MHRWSWHELLPCFSQVNSDATQEGATRFDLTEVEAPPEFAVQAMPPWVTPEFQLARQPGLGLK